MKAVEAKNVHTVKVSMDDYIKFKFYEMLGKVHSPSVWKNVIKKNMNHPRETAQDIAERCGLQSLKTAMQTKCVRSFGILLDCEFVNVNDVTYFNQLLTSVFQKCKRNTTKSLSDAEVAIIKSLLECGADVNTSWSEVSRSLVVFDVDDENCEIEDLHELTERSRRVRTTPLNTAVKAGHSELVKLLFKYQAKVDNWSFLNSPLHHALRHGHIDCAKLLVQHGAKMHIMYALVSAVKYQIPHCMDFLCENYKDEVVNVLQKSNNLNVFVTSAVRGGHLGILRQIFDVGVDYSHVKMPLAESKDGNMARFLIEKGADVNSTQEELCGNLTPLLNVIIKREYNSSTIEVIRVLLESGASTNDRDRYQQTALMIAACREGSISVLQLLLDHGADVSSTDMVGNTALICAILEDCLASASFLIKFAKDRKDVLNAQNNQGLTALMAAASGERLDLISELLCEGADVTIKDNAGDSVLLHYLSEVCMPDEELVLALISAGSDVNCQNKDGLSPLMLATMNYLQEAVSVLLNCGADVNAVSEKDQTKTALSFLPVDSFLEVGAIFCMECLLDKGADASYLNQYFLPKLILNGGDILIPKLIRCGVAPSDIALQEVYPRSSAVGRLSMVSPLCLALLVGNVALAEYFVGNVYLTRSDVSSLMSSHDLWNFLDGNKMHDCVDCLVAFISQPRSLFSLTLVAVSSAVGTSPGRGSRVNTLPVPEKIKHKLLFRSEDAKLIIQDDPKTDTISWGRFRGLRLRLFEEYCELEDAIYSDSELSSSIYNNSDEAIYCDSKLNSSIYNNSDKAIYCDSKLNSSIYNNSDEAIYCDSKLNSSIYNNSDEAIYCNSKLNSSIYNNSDEAIYCDSKLNSSIYNNSDEAIYCDSKLNSSIYNNSDEAIYCDSKLNSSIYNNSDETIYCDSKLNSSIYNNSDEAIYCDSKLNSSIYNNSDEAMYCDSKLNSSIYNNSDEAIYCDSKLNSSIYNNSDEAIYCDSKLNSSIYNHSDVDLDSSLELGLTRICVTDT